MQCEEGYVATKSKRRLTDVGYSTASARALTRRQSCAPMPCKWFFSDPTEESQRIWFHNDNRYAKSYGCVCDYDEGWVATTDRSACVPVFSMSNGEKTANATFSNVRAENYKQRAVTLLYVDNPQTLHRASISHVATLAPHLSKAISSSNTQALSKFLLPPDEFDVLFFEDATRNFSKSVVASSKRRLFLSTLAQESGHGMTVSSIPFCKDHDKSVLCLDTASNVTVNTKYARENEVGGLWWRRLRRNRVLSSEAELETVLLSLSDSMPVRELSNL